MIIIALPCNKDDDEDIHDDYELMTTSYVTAELFLKETY